MPQGILVDYEWCSGCHTCEMACAVELTHKDFPEGHCGVKVHEEGVYPIGGDKWTDINMPVFTDLCDKCADRLAAGEALPSCVKHCQAHVLEFGELEELSKKLAAKPKQVLYAL
jgi:Fe-S-cluster-containing dehydrogenase component